MSDGIGGTDSGKIVPLFTGEASAAGLPPQQAVIEMLENLLAEAKLGKIVGLIYVGLDSQGNYTNGTRGQVVYTAAVTSLEEIKLSIITSNMHAVLVTNS